MLGGDWETDAWRLGDRGMEIGRQMHGDWETEAWRLGDRCMEIGRQMQGDKEFTFSGVTSCSRERLLESEPWSEH